MNKSIRDWFMWGFAGISGLFAGYALFSVFLYVFLAIAIDGKRLAAAIITSAICFGVSAAFWSGERVE